MTVDHSKLDRSELNPTLPRTGELSVRQLRVVIALASALVILLAALVVHQRGLWAPDELRYAQIVRGMDSVSELFVLHLWGNVYTEKPPLFFWLARVAVPFSGGVNLVTLLAPVVFASCLLLTLTGRLAARWYGVCAGTLSVLVLLTLPLFLLLSSIGRMDMLLAVSVTAAVQAFYRGYVDDQRRWCVLAFAWMGVGLLAKGPFGIVFPLAIAIAALALSGKLRNLWRRESLAGVAVLLGLIACWLGPAIYFSGFEYVEELLGRQVLQRAVAGVSHGEPLYFYLWVLPIILLPWVVFLVPSLRSAWKRWRDDRDPRALWLLCWVLVPLVVLSLVREKLPVYLLPAMPPIAILTGRYWSEVFASGQYSLRLQFRVGWVFVLAALVGTVSLAAALLIEHTPSEPGMVRFGDFIRVPCDGEVSCLLLQPPTLCFGGAVLVLLAIVGWASMRTASRRGLIWTFATFAAVAPAGVAFMSVEVMPALDARQSWRAVADAMTAVQDSGEPVVAYGLRPFAAYYLNDNVTWFKKQNSLGDFVQRRGQVWCATHADELSEIERCCVVDHDPAWWYPSPSGPILLVRLRPLEVADGATASEELPR
jgi:4-amino-4-deoxy-L-arabinose transferase-like glycosyltransferase